MTDFHPDADPDDPPLLRARIHFRREGDDCRGRVRAEGEDLFDEYVTMHGLIASLRADTAGPIMTCSCTVPECAGFYAQESLLYEGHVRWSLWYEGKTSSLFSIGMPTKTKPLPRFACSCPRLGGTKSMNGAPCRTNTARSTPALPKRSNPCSPILPASPLNGPHSKAPPRSEPTGN